MARKRVFSTTKFNGGMTNDIRDTSDLSKCAFSSHFDIYGDPHEMQVMPGYVSDMSYQGDPNGMQQFKIRAFLWDNQLWCAGTRASGDGTKIFFKNDFTTTTDWTPGFLIDDGASEGTYDILDRPYAAIIYDSQNLYVSTKNNGDAFWSEFKTSGAGGVVENYHTISSTTTGEYNTRQHVRGGADKSGLIYWNNPNGDLSTLDSTTFTNPAWDTGGYYINGMAESSRGLWTIGYTFQPYNTEVRLWDRNSTLADIVVQIPNSRGGAIGVVSGIPIAVVDENFDTVKSVGAIEEQQNGQGGLSVHAIQAGGTELIYRFTSANINDGELIPTNFNYKDSFVFYAKLALDAAATETREGIWAVGRHNSREPMALSLLLDTSTLGRMNGYRGWGNNMFIAHGTDWSISRLDSFNSGTYDVTATYETLMYGADTPYLKHLNGLTLQTTELPSDGSVSMYYRLDPSDDWTLMGTSSTQGDKDHTFTKAQGSPIGKFNEIQFKFTVVGNVAVTGLTVSMEETDNLPYSL